MAKKKLKNITLESAPPPGEVAKMVLQKLDENEPKNQLERIRASFFGFEISFKDEKKRAAMLSALNFMIALGSKMAAARALAGDQGISEARALQICNDSEKVLGAALTWDEAGRRAIHIEMGYKLLNQLQNLVDLQTQKEGADLDPKIVATLAKLWADMGKILGLHKPGGTTGGGGLSIPQWVLSTDANVLLNDQDQ